MENRKGFVAAVGSIIGVAIFTVLFMVVLVFLTSCADDSNPVPTKTAPVVPREPSCQVASYEKDGITHGVISGMCPSNGYLNGGGVTIDNKAVFYVDDIHNSLRRFVRCPFSFEVSFQTPPAGTDWKYLLLFEPTGVPGVIVCNTARPGTVVQN